MADIRSIGPNAFRTTETVKQRVGSAEVVLGQSSVSKVEDKVVRDELEVKLPSGATFKGQIQRDSVPNSVLSFQAPEWSPRSKGHFLTAHYNQTSGAVETEALISDSRFLTEYPKNAPSLGNFAMNGYAFGQAFGQAYNQPVRKQVSDEGTRSSLRQAINPDGSTRLSLENTEFKMETSGTDASGRITSRTSVPYSVEVDPQGNLKAFHDGKEAEFTVDPKGNGVVIRNGDEERSLGWLVTPNMIQKPSEDTLARAAAEEKAFAEAEAAKQAERAKAFPVPENVSIVAAKLTPWQALVRHFIPGA